MAIIVTRFVVLMQHVLLILVLSHHLTDSSTISLVNTNHSQIGHGSILARAVPVQDKTQDSLKTQRLINESTLSEKHVTWPRKYVELVIVHTYSNYKSYNFNKTKLIDRTKSIVNLLNQLYMPLNIKIALMDIIIWTNKSKSTAGLNFGSFDELPLTDGQILNQTRYYRRYTLLNHINHDHTMLLVSKKMETSKGGYRIGISYVSQMCNDWDSVHVAYDAGPILLNTASTVAHELGHNLGLSHDQCGCSDLPRGCIMHAIDSKHGPATIWSKCSVRAIAKRIKGGLLPCLDDAPLDNTYDGPTCQDGIVEKGEDCDCGTEAEIEFKTCLRYCNASTCRLLPGKCKNSECCNTTTFTFATEHTLCRNASGPCDLPEYCSGHAMFCPSDVFKRNGLPCKSGAYCYDGECNSATDRCKMIWGTNSSSSKPACYSKNTKGKSVGYCKRVARDKYIACDEQDKLCGLVNCENREYLKPMTKTWSIHVYTRDLWSQYGGDCASVSFYPQDGVRQLGLVPNGASCGLNKMCDDSKCISVTTENNATLSCRSNCSTHGVCNSLAQCHCDPGYGSDDCSASGLGGSAHSNSAGLPLPTCQNGVIDEDEECDCGMVADMECMGCCNRRTCQLLPEKQCANGDCCNTTTCTFLSKVSQCRKPVGLCDLPDYCNGNQQSCPANLFKHDGYPCKTDAYCYDGQCRSASDQCRAIWGPSSLSSTHKCFLKNTLGTLTGYCMDKAHDNSYVRIPCAKQDYLCGLVNCEIGKNAKPKMGFVHLVSSGYPKPGKCASVSFHAISGVRQPGLVPNGASCGSNKMCVNSKCVSVGEFLAEKISDACRNNCSGHGVCNSLGQCHCEDGYRFDGCRRPALDITHSKPAVDEEEEGLPSSSIPITVGTVLLLILFLTIVVIIAYRKRERFRKYENTWPFKLLFKYGSNLEKESCSTELTQASDDNSSSIVPELYDVVLTQQDSPETDKTDDSMDDGLSESGNLFEQRRENPTIHSEKRPVAVTAIAQPRQIRKEEEGSILFMTTDQLRQPVGDN